MDADILRKKLKQISERKDGKYSKDINFGVRKGSARLERADSFDKISKQKISLGRKYANRGQSMFTHKFKSNKNTSEYLDLDRYDSNSKSKDINQKKKEIKLQESRNSVARRMGSMIQSMNKAPIIQPQRKNHKTQQSPRNITKLKPISGYSNTKNHSSPSISQQPSPNIRKHRGLHQIFKKKLEDRSLVDRIKRCKGEISFKGMDKDFKEHKIHVHLRQNFMRKSSGLDHQLKHLK